DRAASFTGEQFHAGGHAGTAANDVGHMRAVAVEINRVRVGRQGTVGPHFADEIETADDFGGGEQTIRLGVLHIVRAGAVRGCISRPSARSAKFLVRIVDARVEHRDSYARTVETGGLHSLRPDVRNGFS